MGRKVSSEGGGVREMSPEEDRWGVSGKGWLG